MTPSSRAKRVTPADTRWHPCFVRQRKGPQCHQRGGRHAKWTNSMQQRMENGAQRCNGGGGHRKVSCDHASRSRNAVFLCTLVVVLIPQWAGPGSTRTSMRPAAANSVLLGGRRGPGTAWRTAIWPRCTRPIAPTIGRLFLRHAGRPFGSSLRGLRKSAFSAISLLWAITWGGRGAKGCRTCGIYFQVGRLRTNSKVRATWAPSPGVLALLAGCAAPAPAGD